MQYTLQNRVNVELSFSQDTQRYRQLSSQTHANNATKLKRELGIRKLVCVFQCLY